MASGDNACVGLSETAARLYAGSPAKVRLRHRIRLAICPLDRIVAAVPRNSRVLDVGCGAGLLTALLLESGRASSAVGFDTNPEAVRNARTMAENNRFDGVAVFECLSAGAAWPAGPGSFDVVTMIDVMHHLDPEAQPGIWRRVAETLRPGGLLVYKDMARKPAWMAWANRLHDLVFSGDWIHYTDIDENARLAREAGLVEQERDAFTRYWYRHEMLICVQRQAPAPSGAAIESRPPRCRRGSAANPAAS